MNFNGVSSLAKLLCLVWISIPTVSMAGAYVAAATFNSTAVAIPTDLSSTEIYRTENLKLADEVQVGRKAASYAELGRMLNTASRMVVRPGYAVPFSYYQEFINTNLKVDRALQEIFDDPRMNKDGESAYRAQRLDRIRALMRSRETYISDYLVDKLVSMFNQERMWNGLPKRMELQASSNIEALPQFRGRALYDSVFYNSVTGVVMERSPSKKREDLKFALRQLWASLWTLQAYEERMVDNIPQDKVKMGILITPAFFDETTTGVAVTENLTRNSIEAEPAVSIEAQRGRYYKIFESIASVKSARVLVNYSPSAPLDPKLYQVEQIQASNVASDFRSIMKPNNPKPVIDQDLIADLTMNVLRARSGFQELMAGGENFALAVEFTVSAEDTGAPAVYLKQVRPYTILRSN